MIEQKENNVNRRWITLAESLCLKHWLDFCLYCFFLFLFEST